jgi:hypothetical protein
VFFIFDSKTGAALCQAVVCEAIDLYARISTTMKSKAWTSEEAETMESL